MIKGNDFEWYCPKCGGTDSWFDRTVSFNADGTEQGMTTRCVTCGVSTDDWIQKVTE